MPTLRQLLASCRQFRPQRTIGALSCATEEVSVVPSNLLVMGTAGFIPSPALLPTVFTPDAKQLEVLNLKDGMSAAVIGAAGTGKTRTLIELLTHKVTSGLEPHHVLTLTPNRMAASRLRNMIASRLGQAIKGPAARTPSSLAFSLVAEHATKLGHILPTLLTGSEQDAIIADLLSGHMDEGVGPAWPEPLVPEVRARRAFRSELRDLWSRATERGWNPHDLARIAREAERPEWLAAAEFWDEYRSVITSFRATAFDSAELLALAATALQDASVMDEVRLVLVDDAQELTYGAVRILQAFASRKVPIIAFGDPDISSTTFRGAIPDFLGRMAVELAVDAENVSTIYLDSVHRHGQDIRELVQGITDMGSAQAGQQRSAKSVITESSNVNVCALERQSAHAEVTAVARLLREKHVKDGIDWSRMAVVVRTGSLVPQLARSLSAAEVPTRTLLSERSLREQPAVMDLVSTVAIALGQDELTSGKLQQLLMSPLVGLTVLELRRLRLALRQQELESGGLRTGEEALMEAISNPADLLTLDFAPARRVAKFAQGLTSLREEANLGASIEELLWTVWEASSLAKIWGEEALGNTVLANEANRNLDAVLALFTSAKRFVERFPQRSAGEFIAELFEADVPEDTLAPQAKSEAVQVCTASALIGAEFDVVAIMSIQENLWPNLRPRGSLLHAQELVEDPRRLNSITDEEKRIQDRKSVLDDELRMFALAASRAKKLVILSAQANDDTLPSAFLRKGARGHVIDRGHRDGQLHEYPLTLRGLTGSLRRALTTEVRDGGSPEQSRLYASALSRLASEGIPGAHPQSWYGMSELSTVEPLVNLEEEGKLVSVSPSKLETWKKNQLAWFIESIVGRTSSTAQGIGSIVHTVFEEAGKNPDAPMDAESLWRSIDARWHELSFDAPWLSEVERRRARKMAGALSEYLQDFSSKGKKLLASEGGFELEIGHAKVRGYIDRVEENISGEVVIVDLKTGKSFPAAKDVPEHSQLACYQLALTEGAISEAPENPTNGGAKLIYVTDGVRGKLYREIVQEPYDAEAIATIKENIETAALGMAGNSFEAVVYIQEEKGVPHSRYEYRIHVAQAVSAS